MRTWLLFILIFLVSCIAPNEKEEVSSQNTMPTPTVSDLPQSTTQIVEETEMVVVPRSDTEKYEPTLRFIDEEVSDDSNAIEVSQKIYAITSAAAAKPILQTWGSGPCVVVIIYDPSSKIGMLAHIDALTEVEDSFETIIQTFRELTEQENIVLEAIIVQGMHHEDMKTYSEIIDALERLNVTIVYEHLLNLPLGLSASAQFDTRTGIVQPYDETTRFPRKCPYCTDENARILCDLDYRRKKSLPMPIGDPTWVYKDHDESWRIGDAGGIGKDDLAYQDCYDYGAGFNEGDNIWKCQCTDDWNLREPSELDKLIRQTEELADNSGESLLFSHPESIDFVQEVVKP
jgi:hypothetical protein